jgi:hypothetical protein
MEKLWEFEENTPSGENPKKFLYQIAYQLKLDTDGLIEALITENSSESEPEIIFAFYLVAPRLRNYSYRLFQIEFKHLVAPYPIKCIQYAKAVKNNQHFECIDFKDFEKKLKEHIKNPITKGIITTIKTHIDIVEHYED